MLFVSFHVVLDLAVSILNAGDHGLSEHLTQGAEPEPIAHLVEEESLAFDPIGKLDASATPDMKPGGLARGLSIRPEVSRYQVGPHPAPTKLFRHIVVNVDLRRLELAAAHMRPNTSACL